MRRSRTARLALGLALSFAAAAAGSGVEITYLANEGFLLAAGNDKVLVDALFPGIDGYPRVPAELRDELARADPPFDGVDLVLATHFHDDHFGANEVAEFLAASGALFVSTPDAVARLDGRIDPGADVRALFPGTGERSAVDLPGIRLTVLNLHHGRSRLEIQNLGFLIELGGVKILHVGDTEVGVEDIDPYDLAAEKVDVALLPGWFLTEPVWQDVIDRIQPRHVVAMHLASPDAPASWFGSAGSRQGRVERIRQSWPAAWVPGDALESKLYRPAEPGPSPPP